MNRCATLTFLGTGTSQGVPVIGCRCDVCRSGDPRDARLRTSALYEAGECRILFDAGPDFRVQMLRRGISRLSAILLTHKHKDHIGGIDDVRALNFVDYPRIRPVHIYATPDTAACVRKDFDYAFEARPYRGVPVIELHEIDPSRPFEVDGVEIIPVSGRHERFEVTGYRIGDAAYMTDFKSIDDVQLSKLCGVNTLVINALRFTPHDSHLSVGEALDIIRRIAPQRAYLTHMSHEIGLHALADAQLPPGVRFAYDGLEIEIG